MNTGCVLKSVTDLLLNVMQVENYRKRTGKTFDSAKRNKGEDLEQLMEGDGDVYQTLVGDVSNPENGQTRTAENVSNPE